MSCAVRAATTLKAIEMHDKSRCWGHVLHFITPRVAKHIFEAAADKKVAKQKLHKIAPTPSRTATDVGG